MKPPDAKCTTQWGRDTVTDVYSRNNLSVDGISRHILDEDSSDAREEVEANEVVPKSSQRERRQPVWMRDYVKGSDCEQE